VRHDRLSGRGALGRKRAAELRPLGADVFGQLNGVRIALDSVLARVSDLARPPLGAIDFENTKLCRKFFGWGLGEKSILAAGRPPGF
jgi:hypothetical protein